MCVGIDYVRTVPFITQLSVLGYHSPCGGCAGISVFGSSCRAGNHVAMARVQKEPPRRTCNHARCNKVARSASQRVNSLPLIHERFKEMV